MVAFIFGGSLGARMRVGSPAIVVRRPRREVWRASAKGEDGGDFQDGGVRWNGGDEGEKEEGVGPEQDAESAEAFDQLAKEVSKRRERGDRFPINEWSGAREAIALLFRQGESEGVYSVAMEDGTDIIIVFEDADDATRYAEMLAAEDFPQSSIEVVETRVIDDICKQTGASFAYFQRGTIMIPPKQNKESSINDWVQKEDRQSATSKQNDDLKGQLERLFQQ